MRYEENFNRNNLQPFNLSSDSSSFKDYKEGELQLFERKSSYDLFID